MEHIRWNIILCFALLVCLCFASPANAGPDAGLYPLYLHVVILQCKIHAGRDDDESIRYRYSVFFSYSTGTGNQMYKITADPVVSGLRF